MKLKYISIKQGGMESFDSYLEDYTTVYKDRTGTVPRRIGRGNKEPLIRLVKAEDVVQSSAGVTPSFTQRIKLEAMGDLSSISDWEDIVTSYFSEGTSLYMDSTIYLPDYKVPESEENPKRQLFGPIHSYYNFKSKLYEKYSVGTEQVETRLPPHVVGLYQKEYPDSIISKLMLNFDGTDGNIYNMLTKIPDSPNRNNKMFIYNTGNNLDNNYFYEKAKRAFNDAPDFSIPELTQKIFVNFELPNGTSRFIYDVPFYNNIELHFDLDTVRDFTKIIIDTGMQDVLMKSIDTLTSDFIDYNTEDSSLMTNSDSIKYYKTWDAYELFNSVNIEEIINSKNIDAILYDENLSAIKYENPDVLYNVTKAILTAELNNFFTRQDFNFKNIFIGKEKCYNELIGYKIEKTPNDINSTKQEFYFFNHGGVKQFIDSQIKFEESYRYDISAIYLIVGAEYSSEIVSIEKGQPNIPMTAEIAFKFKPHIKILEIPVESKELRIQEPPPLEPIVNFRNAKYIKNKIEIDLDERQGVTTSLHDRKRLTIIEEADSEYSAKLEEYMDSEYFYYSNIASGKTYEIYRMETKPKKLSDFRGNLYYLLENKETDRYDNKTRSLLTFTDFLQHDKPYYYMFRALTHRGNPSNPSPVYEIEKTRDSDETFLKINIIDLEEKEQYSMETSFRRFMNIAIRDDHLSIDDDTYIDNETGDEHLSANQANLVMGDKEVEDKIWNYNNLDSNYIKLRLESKNSGKKIDLNLIFNYNQPKNDN